MSLKDWIQSPVDWGEWGTKLNAWMADLVKLVRATEDLAAALNDDLTAAEIDIAALETNRQGYAFSSLASWNTGTTTSAVTATSVTAFGLVAGKTYKVSFSTHVFSTVAQDSIRLRIVGPSVTPIYSNFDNTAIRSGIAQHASGYFWFTPVVSADYNFFLQYFRATGTGSVTVFADANRLTFMTVEPLQ